MTLTRGIGGELTEFNDTAGRRGQRRLGWRVKGSRLVAGPELVTQLAVSSLRHASSSNMLLEPYFLLSRFHFIPHIAASDLATLFPFPAIIATSAPYALY